MTEAIVNNFATEIIDGYLCPKTKVAVEASKSMTLEELPPILVLHLKRFVYDGSGKGSQKLCKNIDFPGIGSSLYFVFPSFEVMASSAKLPGTQSKSFLPLFKGMPWGIQVSSLNYEKSIVRKKRHLELCSRHGEL